MTALERPDLRVATTRLRRPSTGDGRVSIEPRSIGWRYLSFEVVQLGPTPLPFQAGHNRELAVVVVAGRDVRIQTATLETNLEGRDGPFSGLPWAAWLPSAPVVLLSASGGATVAIATAPRSDRTEAAREPIVISPSMVRVEVRGTGNVTRQVNHIIAPEFPADRLLVVEVLTPAGNWSSWPPHKHDVDALPNEAALEEVYFYQFRRVAGWGTQRLYRRRESMGARPARDKSWAVRHGDVVLVPDGYHPFVANPVDDAYYLNALAGDHRTMACSFDRDQMGPIGGHAWAQLDPRVPIVPPDPR